MPYEIFMAVQVPIVPRDADRLKTCAILTGITQNQPRHCYTKVTHIERDPAIKGMPTLKDLLKERSPTNPAQPHWNSMRWKELDQILAKQSYTMQLRVDLTAEVESAADTPDAPIAVPDGVTCTLRWNDMPDPTTSRQPPYLTQRKTLDISDPRMPKIMADNKWMYVSSPPLPSADVASDI